MRPTYWILGLATLSIVIGLFMSRDPERAERLNQMYRDAALTGEARQCRVHVRVAGVEGAMAPCRQGEVVAGEHGFQKYIAQTGDRAEETRRAAGDVGDGVLRIDDLALDGTRAEH